MYVSEMDCEKQVNIARITLRIWLKSLYQETVNYLTTSEIVPKFCTASVVSWTFILEVPANKRYRRFFSVEPKEVKSWRGISLMLLNAIISRLFYFTIA
jgi:hypothetical protein